MLNQYIKTFIEVVENGSFSSAAEKLYMSKVSVMNQINQLESHIGTILLNRTNHGVNLTEAGNSFYKNSQKILKLSEEAIQEAKFIGRSDNIIRVGTSMMRPCNELIKLWEGIKNKSSDIQFNIVPFDDGVNSLNIMLKSLGERIDCFVSPCSSMKILMNYSFLPFNKCKYCISMSKKHNLAKKKSLKWEDLDGESLILVQRGESFMVDELRDEISKFHKNINIVDFNGYYDATTFNMCEQKGYLIGTMDIWANLHPSLITLPMKWNYSMDYGILYAKEPSQKIKDLIKLIEQSLTK